jgi:CHAT domain
VTATSPDGLRLVLSAESDAPEPGRNLAEFLGQPNPRIIVTDSDGTAERWNVDAASAAVLRAGVASIYAGTIDPAAAQDVGRRLWCAVGAPLSRANAYNDSIELTAPEQQQWLLADVPWEFARDATGPPLGEKPLTRFVPRPQNGCAETSRPSVLLAIVNAQALSHQPIRPLLFAQPIAAQLASTPPYVLARQLGVSGDAVTYDAFLAAVHDVAPQVVVLVTHGVTRDAPFVFFEGPDPKVPNRKATGVLARDLIATSSIILTVLLSCDQMHTGNAASGGLSFVDSGMPELIAMQGEIPQNDAAAFLGRALAGLFTFRSLGRAVSFGRGAVPSETHALTPVALRSRDEMTSRATWDGIAARYRAALRSLTPPAPPALVRPWLNDVVDAILERNGVTLVVAPEDPSGRGVLAPLAQRAAAYLEAGFATFPPRIVLFVDLLADPAEDAPAGSDPLRIVDCVGALLREIAILLPGGAAAAASTARDPAAAADQLVELLDDNAVCAVVSGVDLVGANATAFWSRVGVRAAAALKRGALVVAPVSGAADAAQRMLSGFDVQQIPALDAAEIATVMAHELGLLQMSAETVRERSEGNPAILRALRDLCVGGAPDPAAVEALFCAQGRTIAERIVNATLQWLQPEDVPKVVALSYVRTPAAPDLTVRLLLLDDWPLYRRLVANGFVTAGSRTDPEIGERFEVCSVSAEVARVVQARYPNQAREAGNALLAALPADPQIDAFVAQRGGAAVLRAAQLLLRDLAVTERAPRGDDASLAYDVGRVAATSPSRGSVSQRLILAMLLTSDQMLIDLGERDSNVLFWIMKAAHEVQDDDAYDAALQAYRALPADSIPIDIHARVLVLEAERIRNRRQAAGIPDALAKLDEARAVLANASNAPAPNDIPLAWHEVLYARLKIAAFFQRERVDENQSFRELVDHPLTPIERAVALCTFAENEMSRPPGEIRWDRVRAWTEAAEPDAKAGEPDLRAYCLYQIAQYSRKRPEPRPEIADGLYQSVAELSRDTGDVAREALALVRRAEVARMPGAPNVAPPQVRNRLAELLAQRASRPRDSLEARAFERAHRVLAELASDIGEKARHLREAAALCALPMLSSRTDARRLAAAVAGYLEVMLGREGAFMPVRRFLGEIGAALTERTQIPVDRDEPAALLTKLREHLAANGH